MKRTVSVNKQAFKIDIVMSGEDQLTDEADTGIGTGLALFTSGAEQATDDKHTDGGARDTGQEKLSATDVVNDGGSGESTEHGGETVDQVQDTLTVTVGDTGEAKQSGKEV